MIFIKGNMEEIFVCKHKRFNFNDCSIPIHKSTEIFDNSVCYQSICFTHYCKFLPKDFLPSIISYIFFFFLV